MSGVSTFRRVSCGAWLSLLLLALSWGLWGQGSSSLLEDLDQLGCFLDSLERENGRQSELLRDLSGRLESSESELANSRQAISDSNQAITDLRSISETQGDYLRSLRFQLEQQRLIYQAQSAYTRGLQSRSRILSVSLIVGVPVAAGLGIWAGWMLSR